MSEEIVSKAAFEPWFTISNPRGRTAVQYRVTIYGPSVHAGPSEKSNYANGGCELQQMAKNETLCSKKCTAALYRVRQSSVKRNGSVSYLRIHRLQSTALPDFFSKALRWKANRNREAIPPWHCHCAGKIEGRMPRAHIRPRGVSID